MQWVGRRCCAALPSGICADYYREMVLGSISRLHRLNVDMKILLVSPRTPDTFWSFKHAVRFVSRKASMPPLGLLTVAAMLPLEWQLKLVDLNVERLKDEDLRWADYVLLGAMLVQKDSVREIVARCATFQKRVIAGGPLFTTGYEAFPEIQHFVLGEAEEVMPQVVEDLRSGRLQDVYKRQHRRGLVVLSDRSSRPHSREQGEIIL